MSQLGHYQLGYIETLSHWNQKLRRSEFEGLDSYFKNEYNKANEVL